MANALVLIERNEGGDLLSLKFDTTTPDASQC